MPTALPSVCKYIIEQKIIVFTKQNLKNSNFMFKRILDTNNINK